MNFEKQSQAKKVTGLSYMGAINSSAKIVKNAKKGVDTYIIYLAPAEMSGYNVCPKSTAECRNACLAGSGHNRINTDGRINSARIKKTKLYFEDRQFFSDWVVAEIEAHKAKAEKQDRLFAVRINGTSDLSPEMIKQGGKNLLRIFSGTQFYDYTKVLNRSKLLQKYNNYDLTFSYTGENWLECEAAYAAGMRVAAVFAKVPSFYKGIPVINGDESDLRYLDPKDCIVGLKYKLVKNKIDFTKSKFIIPVTDKDCAY